MGKFGSVFKPRVVVHVVPYTIFLAIHNVVTAKLNDEEEEHQHGKHHAHQAVQGKGGCADKQVERHQNNPRKHIDIAHGSVSHQQNGE